MRAKISSASHPIWRLLALALTPNPPAHRASRTVRERRGAPEAVHEVLEGLLGADDVVLTQGAGNVAALAQALKQRATGGGDS